MPRLDVAVITRAGDAEVVNICRPATLIAFGAEHNGKEMPDTPSELFWSAHHALGIDAPLAEWTRGLELCSAFTGDVELARRIIAGDDHARAVALGQEPPDRDLLRELEEAQLGALGLGAVDPGAPPDPTPPAPAPVTPGGTK
jgi:hypothetical protein